MRESPQHADGGAVPAVSRRTILGMGVAAGAVALAGGGAMAAPQPSRMRDLIAAWQEAVRRSMAANAASVAFDNNRDALIPPPPPPLMVGWGGEIAIVDGEWLQIAGRDKLALRPAVEPEGHAYWDRRDAVWAETEAESLRLHQAEVAAGFAQGAAEQALVDEPATCLQDVADRLNAIADDIASFMAPEKLDRHESTVGQLYCAIRQAVADLERLDTVRTA